ncbi:MAG: hypothetical protein GYA57_16990 [Myxococcales bacterium]|nr:hypothetical protein [Myxococcales bacterium]
MRLCFRRAGLPQGLVPMLALAGATACGLQAAGLGSGDAEDRAPRDDGGGEAAPDVPDGADALVCPPAQAWCSVGALLLCSEDGLSYSTTPCPLGCSEDPRAHCRKLVPSNVPDGELLCAGSENLAVRPETRLVTFQTATGAIDEWTEGLVLVRRHRPEGEGVLEGIHYARVPQPDGAPTLGVFSFSSLLLPSGVTLAGVGSGALVLLSCGDVTIEGTVFVGAAEITDRSGVTHRAPGPGGADAGAGPGAGGDGAWDPGYELSGGGGGGAFGAAGGAGGAGGYAGAALAGAAGRAYGTPELVPLWGGSGGGKGGCLGMPDGLGGAGGGALQITARGTLRVRGRIDAGGLGGAGGCDRDGAGGGGGSGGGVLLEADRLVVEAGAVIAVNGGGGGSGIGYSAYGYDSHPGQRGEARLTAAAGGADPGTYGCAGGEGSSAVAPAGGSFACLGADDFYGGGGGGGAGRIRLNGNMLEVARNTLSPAEGAPGTTTTTGVPPSR